MASSDGGRCCVCGTSTSQRCSACSAAGFSLFFCSREHQKLVYFAHKKVCGKNAKPFRFPPLSLEEAAEAKSGLHDRYLAKDRQTCIADQVQRAVHCSVEAVPAIIDSLAQDISDAFATGLVCSVRSSLASRRGYILAQQEVFAGVADPQGRSQFLNPLTRLSAFALRVASCFAHHSGHSVYFPVEEDWYIELLHHHLIFSAI
ncbi:hypothetical protein JCM6882_009697 [Rhodosporidiobolus microsporus]